MPHQGPGGRAVRTPEEVKGVARGPALSLWRTAKERVAVERPSLAPAPLTPPAPAPPRRTMRDRFGFLRRAVIQWISQYLAHLFQGRRPLPAYGAGRTGIYRL